MKDLNNFILGGMCYTYITEISQPFFLNFGAISPCITFTNIT